VPCTASVDVSSLQTLCPQLPFRRMMRPYGRQTSHAGCMNVESGAFGLRLFQLCLRSLARSELR
jgi:hypothetical protein